MVACSFAHILITNVLSHLKVIKNEIRERERERGLR